MLAEYTQFLFEHYKDDDFSKISRQKLMEMLPDDLKDPDFIDKFLKVLKREEVRFKNGISINFMLHVVCINDERVNLTPCEVSIIEELAKAEDYTLTFEELAFNVWHYTADICNIRVNVTNIRRKMGNYIIENIKGKGYRLNVTKNIKRKD